ncbi:PQQ-binding-like beta-propeller repeat protein [Carboxylicivirga sp. RSCT41]|uniref:outer membrane protein assembly factor BamB family protein n=1 Tax=Carboxylicivirga agarovorans TaxID=3417570 RepID=UPI003D339C14
MMPMNPKYLCILLMMVCAVACRPKEEVIIAFLTDIHVEPGNTNEGYFAEVVSEINHDGIYDFVVITGDLTNMGSDNELLAVKNILNSLEIPYYILPGNHETNWSETGGATYQRLFGDDRFFFSTDAFQFVGFNTGPYMKMGDGHVKQEDLFWLEKMLKQSDANKHLISMAHYPLADGLDNWPEVTAQLKKHEVKMAFCGHGHKLQLLNFNGITGVMGRALVGHDKQDVGYNIIELEGDIVRIKSKRLGYEPQLAFSWDMGQSSQIDSMKLPPSVDYSINEWYKNIEVKVLTEASASVLGGVAYDNECIYWLASDGLLNCYDLPKDRLLWSQDLGKPQYSSPVVYQQFAIVGTSQGFIKAFHKHTGELVWQTDVKYPVFSEGRINNDHLYVACGKGGMLKLNALTGEIIWQYKDVGGFVQASPCITNDKVIFGAWDRFLHCIDKQTGEMLWKWTNGHGATLYSPGNVVPVVSDEKVFIVAPDRHMTVIDLESGEQLFRTNKHKVRESCGISADGRFFFAKSMNDSIVAYPTDEPDKGNDWVVNVGFGYEHNPVPLVESHNVLYGGTKNGEVFAVDIQEKELLWRYKVCNSSLNKIVPLNDRELLASFMDGSIVKLVDKK